MTKATTGVQPVKDKPAKSGSEDLSVSVGKGGEWHQRAIGDQSALTTNQGLPISDNQNSLRANPSGWLFRTDPIPGKIHDRQSADRNR
jgi:catalase